MKILEQVKNRILAWKRIFTQEHSPVNEISSWREILLELTEEENLSLWKEAKQTCGCFSPEEKQALNNLPYFQKIVAELKTTPNHRIKPFWRLDFPNGEKIQWMLFRNHFGGIPMIEVTVITPQTIELKTDIYIFTQNSAEMKNIVIRYVSPLFTRERPAPKERKKTDKQPSKAKIIPLRRTQNR